MYLISSTEIFIDAANLFVDYISDMYLLWNEMCKDNDKWDMQPCLLVELSRFFVYCRLVRDGGTSKLYVRL